MSAIDRKVERSGARAKPLSTMAFLKLADKFIDVANRENRKIPATELHMAFLYAAARYNAHVANAVMEVDDHEAFVAEMTKQYQEMLRQNLGDPSMQSEDDERAAEDEAPHET
ncbi:MAG: DUF3144 domain-containing protein [Pseudomonadota bacterium]